MLPAVVGALRGLPGRKSGKDDEEGPSREEQRKNPTLAGRDDIDGPGDSLTGQW